MRPQQGQSRKFEMRSPARGTTEGAVRLLKPYSRKLEMRSPVLKKASAFPDFRKRAHGERK